MELNDLAAASGVALGLTQALAMAGLPDRFKPLASIAAGIVVATLILSALTTQGALWGIVAGLSASGLYSGGKTITARATPPQGKV